MKGNICNQCLEQVHKTTYMRSSSNWGICEVCGKTGVFYARLDEIKEAKRQSKIKEQKEL